jgi:glycogen debranching enzyme
VTEPWTFPGDAPSVRRDATVTLVEGSSFAIVGRDGDIDGEPEGVFVGDTRVVSRLAVTVDGHRVEQLAHECPTPFAATFVGRVGSRGLLVTRRLFVGAGLRVEVAVANLSGDDRAHTVRVEVDTDLADLFEVKEGRAGGAHVPSTAAASDGCGPGELHLGVRSSRRATVVRTSPPAACAGSVLEWQATVPAKQEWSGCLEVAAVRGGEEVVPRLRCGQSVADAIPVQRRQRWGARLPAVSTDIDGLPMLIRRAADDLGALRIFESDRSEEPVVAAGAPWFMTLFGRDSLLTSWMALLLAPELALSTLHVLARLQGRRTDTETEEQPGRILHEIRFGETASLALDDGALYFGTADATPLFVMLVGELWRWGVPWERVEPLLPAVDAALGWVAGPGDPDGDGYVEYERMSEAGLRNQGWKDSWDGIAFAGGPLADAPIALAEVQGYVYAAWTAGADLAAAAGRHDVADERRQRAAALHAAFNRDFWLDGESYVAVALDREKRPVDAITSNAGHCLWTGIVDGDRAVEVARRLAGAELFSGWGVRTLSPRMARYDPLSYHNGSVWPHDTAICVAGMRRAGCIDEAVTVAQGLLRAALASGGRLPELFSGLGPDVLGVPVAYPASCSPQAWASAAPLLVVRTLLGLEPDIPAGRVTIDPVLPQGATTLRLRDVPLAGTDISIEVEDDAVAVRGLPRGLAVVRPA